MLHINQSHMDVRKYQSRLDEKLLSRSHLRCGVSKHQVLGGGIFGNIQIRPCIFHSSPDVLPSPKKPLPFFLFFMMIQLCSQLLRPKIIVIIDSLFFILIFSTAPSTHFWIPINSPSIVTLLTVITIWRLFHLLFVYHLLVLPCTISSMRAEILTVFTLFHPQHL